MCLTASQEIFSNLQKRLKKMNICSKTLLCLTAALYLTSCTNQQLYNAIQNNEQSRCEEQPPADYDRCIEDHNESYLDYKKKRGQVTQ